MWTIHLVERLGPLYRVDVDKTNRGDDISAKNRRRRTIEGFIYQNHPPPPSCGLVACLSANEDDGATGHDRTGPRIFVVLFRCPPLQECHFFVGCLYYADYEFGHRHTTWRGCLGAHSLSGKDLSFFLHGLCAKI